MFLGLILYANVYSFIAVTTILLTSNNATWQNHISDLLSKYNWILETSIGGGIYGDRHMIFCLSFFARMWVIKLVVYWLAYKILTMHVFCLNLSFV